MAKKSPGLGKDQLSITSFFSSVKQLAPNSSPASNATTGTPSSATTRPSSSATTGPSSSSVDEPILQEIRQINCTVLSAYSSWSKGCPNISKEDTDTLSDALQMEFYPEEVMHEFLSNMNQPSSNESNAMGDDTHMAEDIASLDLGDLSSPMHANNETYSEPSTSHMTSSSSSSSSSNVPNTRQDRVELMIKHVFRAFKCGLRGVHTADHLADGSGGFTHTDMNNILSAGRIIRGQYGRSGEGADHFQDILETLMSGITSNTDQVGYPAYGLRSERQRTSRGMNRRSEKGIEDEMDHLLRQIQKPLGASLVKHVLDYCQSVDLDKTNEVTFQTQTISLLIIALTAPFENEQLYINL